MADSANLNKVRSASGRSLSIHGETLVKPLGLSQITEVKELWL